MKFYQEAEYNGNIVQYFTINRLTKQFIDMLNQDPEYVNNNGGYAKSLMKIFNCDKKKLKKFLNLTTKADAIKMLNKYYKDNEGINKDNYFDNIINNFIINPFILTVNYDNNRRIIYEYVGEIININ